MRTIRRLYLYGVSIISLMVIIWGLIGLARSAFAGDTIGGDVARLAGALALILVGVPVFLLHWWLAQRSARSNDDERFSRIRAFFLYGALLATIIPVTQNLLALINRLFFQIVDAEANRILFGFEQTWTDNLIAILMNGLVAAYIFNVLRQNWAEENMSAAFLETRRLYRLIWMFYGLGLTIFGLQQILLFLLDLLGDAANVSRTILANGLTMSVVGLPLWWYSWRILQKAFTDEEEQNSLLRLISLYAVRLIALFATLAGIGAIVESLLQSMLEGTLTLSILVEDLRDPLSMVVPVGLVWVFFSRTLREENKVFSGSQSRTEIQRLYNYLASLVGLIAFYVGLHGLIYTLIDLLPLDNLAGENTDLWSRSFRRNLAEALAILTVSVPLWLINWIPVNRMASSATETGEQNRRSVIRRGYLYLVLFVGVIGIMVSAGMLIFHVLQALLGEPDQDFAVIVIELVSSLVLFVALLWYHGRLVQTDGRLASENLAAKHTEFPVLVLVSEIGAFSEAVIAALRRTAPDMPVAVHVIDQGIPDETLSNAKAVILPAGIAASSQEAIRLWVQNFQGVRFLIPTPARGWVWVSGNGNDLKDLIQQATEKVRKLAEGENIYMERFSPWKIIGYIAGGIVGLILVLMLFGVLVDLFF